MKVHIPEIQNRAKTDCFDTTNSIFSQANQNFIIIKMSTNNNLIVKEVRPIWKNEESEKTQIKTVSGVKIERLMTNSPNDCTALSLSNRSIQQIDDLKGFGSNLRRLDLSDNKISRLHGFVEIPKISFLNISGNEFSGDSGLEELRYLNELRTLNLGRNPEIKTIQSHIVKPLAKLQALIMNECGLTKVSFIRFLPLLNTLILSNNNITSLSIETLGKFEFLAKISIGHNQLTAWPDLSSLTSLSEVRINHNQITTLPNDLYLKYKNLKILDISNNQLNEWNSIESLAKIESLTNLTIHDNPLPLPSTDIFNLALREDISADTKQDNNEKLYRRNILLLFQKLVGKFSKPFVQLVVLDNKRVKTKWTQGGAKNNSHNDNDNEIVTIREIIPTLKSKAMIESEIKVLEETKPIKGSRIGFTKDKSTFQSIVKKIDPKTTELLNKKRSIDQIETINKNNIETNNKLNEKIMNEGKSNKKKNKKMKVTNDEKEKEQVVTGNYYDESNDMVASEPIEKFSVVKVANTIVSKPTNDVLDILIGKTQSNAIGLGGDNAWD